MRAKLLDSGGEPLHGTAEVSGKLMHAQTLKGGKVLEAAGMKLK